MNNLRNAIFVVLASGLSVSGLAQTVTVSWFQAKLDDKAAVNTVSVQFPRKFELWVADVTAPKPFIELVGPQLELKGSSGLLRLGPYLRLQNIHVVRLGAAGLVVIGKSTGWTLVSPFYLFTEKGKAGYWFPNLRVTHPIGSGWRGGVGLGTTNTQGKPTSLVIGPYLSWESKEVLFQLRVGQQLSPSPLAGKTQVFAGISYKF